jgi:pantoate--beta-alanine ligase
MEILRTVAALRAWSRGERSKAQKTGTQTAHGHSIGLVPTMGALHAGHASLIEAAARSCGRAAVSIFVNPTQFGPNEDFARYPRSFEADCRLAEESGAHVIFAPSVEEMYPGTAPSAAGLIDPAIRHPECAPSIPASFAGMDGKNTSESSGPINRDLTFVEVAALSNRLDGASRPGHFRGVATVVAKLLIACEPDRAFFGQKDAAQVAVLRRMVEDLRIGTDIVVCPIVREADGLALSSRNAYLRAEERSQARVLSRAVRAAEGLVATGERRAEVLVAAGRAVFAGEPEVRVDYVELVDWGTLLPVEFAAPGTLFAVAAWVGATRLIDNTVLP